MINQINAHFKNPLNVYHNIDATFGNAYSIIKLPLDNLFFDTTRLIERLTNATIKLDLP